MNSIQNQAQISYISAGETNVVKTPDVNTTIIDPNIHVIKSCCVNSAQRGSEIRYTVSIINSGEVATSGNVVLKDYLDKAGTHVADSAKTIRNNIVLTAAPSLDALTRETYWFAYTPDENVPSVTVTSLLPGDIVIVTYSVYIDEETPLINNELHNTASATFDLNSQTIVQRSDICTVNVNYSLLLADKRGRAQGHDGSNLYYALELTNDGTSAASNIQITEHFPNSFQPNSGFEQVAKDIAIVNFLRHPNSIENVVTRSEVEKDNTASLNTELNARYYRLKSQLQSGVLAAIADLSTKTLEQQQELMNTTTTAILPELESALTLAESSYNLIFTNDPNADPQFACILTTITTLAASVNQAKTHAAGATLPDNKDQRASFVCDAHDGGIVLLDLCDIANDAITMVAVVYRYIATIAIYLQREFEVLGMDSMPEYQANYVAISEIAVDSRANLSLCTEKKEEVVAKIESSEQLMTEIMALAFSDVDQIKEVEANYTVEADPVTNEMILTMNGVEIHPQILVGALTLNGHMDIYLDGRIDIKKF